MNHLTYSNGKSLFKNLCDDTMDELYQSTTGVHSFFQCVSFGQLQRQNKMLGPIESG